jgi:peroxiredoxin
MRRIQFRKSIGGILLCGAALIAAGGSRKSAPDFVLKDVRGSTVKLSDYRGKVVLLDFWATWCAGCRTEIPWFTEFEKSYKDRGFAVLGVSMDEDGWSAVEPFIQERKVNYRILMRSEQIAELYGGLNALPQTFLIDRTGRIASVHVGVEGGKDGFRREIENLLASH